MKIMISQPMRGKTTEQIKQEREELVKELENQGYEILNTVFDDFPKGKATPAHYLAKSIEYLADADGIVFMPGWEEARGCNVEYHVAKEYGKFIKTL